MSTCKQFKHRCTIKKKLLSASHSQYVTKDLRKAIIRRFKLEKIYISRNKLMNL